MTLSDDNLPMTRPPVVVSNPNESHHWCTLGNKKLLSKAAGASYDSPIGISMTSTSRYRVAATVNDMRASKLLLLRKHSQFRL